MKITSKTAETIRPEAVRAEKSATAGTSRGTGTAAASTGAVKSDAVQISDAGRALAGGTSGVSTERMAQIRSRIQEGAYSSLAVVDEVARRILEGGHA